MIAIMCLDINNGMLFNKRRVSRDKIIIEDIIINYGLSINMSEYSSKMFSQYKFNCISNSNIYFIEDNISLDCYTELVVYNFNRRYPSDFVVSLDAFILVSESDIVGNSHKKITKSIYRRKEV